MKLRSFGCSFIYGSELVSRHKTWPGIIGEKLTLPHVNHGIEGAGNLRILEAILTHVKPADICVVNWTWIDRFDFVKLPDERWDTIRPSCTDSVSEVYYSRLHSQYRDMLVNLIYVKTAIDHLHSLGVPFVMTYLDRLLFEPVTVDWHQGQAVSGLQKSVQPFMKDFDGLTFLEWSRAQNYTESARWHPLDDAHSGAADLMLPVIESILHKA